ncbi:Putative Peptidyl-prolyl cis-trans isomerase [[Torrubiella] hemipterigena]|uniref:peptidylprolyl isomerase n=1 Tax=[Torrubiella] hemipterigena TaxID=1531966 RepID=A0A0A1T284_9HYPO|nr:Putative Peptidyl-prolyl cis-trans isomerase [[Torrubiella] hemipterigena]
MKATFFVAAAVLGLASAGELKIDVTRKVKCERKTKAGDSVAMHYRGTLQDTGKQFDASYDRGQPFRFNLGSGQVIKGWDQGLLDMCIGEKRTLTIPPEFGYGERGIGPIPGGATLVFETELLSIDGVETPEKIEEVEDEAKEAEDVPAEETKEEEEGKSEL